VVDCRGEEYRTERKVKGQPSSNENSQTGLRRCRDACQGVAEREVLSGWAHEMSGMREQGLAAWARERGIRWREGYGLELVGSIWKGWLVGSHFRAWHGMAWHGRGHGERYSMHG